MVATLARINDSAKLFSLPDLYFRLRAILDDPEFALPDVAALVGQDPGMTARLLRLVNSPFFGFAAKIDTVSRAVGMLGGLQVHDLVLATSVTEAFSGLSSKVMDMRRFWRYSVCCAVAARLLASSCNVLDNDRLFVAGLLCDIGHLILYQQLPEAAQRSIDEARRQERPLFRVERELLGFDYAQVGGLLVRQWRLPKGLREAVELHVEPARALEFPRETAIVHIAHALAAATHAGTTGVDGELPVDIHAWRLSGLTPEACTAVSAEVEAQVSDVLELIAPQ